MATDEVSAVSDTADELGLGDALGELGIDDLGIDESDVRETRPHPRS